MRGIDLCYILGLCIVNVHYANTTMGNYVHFWGTDETIKAIKATIRSSPWWFNFKRDEKKKMEIVHLVLSVNVDILT